MVKGGGVTTSFEVVVARELEVLTILMGGAKGFHPLKGGGGQKVLPCLKGGAKSLGPTIFPFCSPSSL